MKKIFRFYKKKGWQKERVEASYETVRSRCDIHKKSGAGAGIESFPLHSTNSLNLSPSDFHLFYSVESFLSGYSVWELYDPLKNSLNKKTELFILTEDNLAERCREGVESRGNYFDDWIMLL